LFITQAFDLGVKPVISNVMVQNLSIYCPHHIIRAFLSAGELLMLLNVSSDEKVLPTTYGELRPPLGKHRLKVSFNDFPHQVLGSCYGAHPT